MSEGSPPSLFKVCVFNRLKKSLQKKLNFSSYMKAEMKAADFVANYVPKMYDLWKQAGVELIGHNEWESFVRHPAFLGYLFTWCDLMAMSMDAEQGGTGSLSGYVRALQIVAPHYEPETTIENTIALFTGLNPEIHAGARAAHKDYNRFAGASDKTPIHLYELIKTICGK